MKLRHDSSLSIGIAGLLLLLSFQNCAQPRLLFEQASNLDALSGSLDSGDGTDSPTHVVCDPFSNSAGGAPGLKAKMVYYEGADARDKIKSVTDIFSLGSKVEDTILYFSQVSVPTRSFVDGFDTTSGEKLRTPSGQILTEWFGLRFESNLQLMEADQDGLYQLATLSDDGSILEVKTGEDYGLVVNNDGLASTRLRCGSTILLAKGQKFPMRLWYFQGPRTEIAVNVLWRRVSSMNPSPSGACETSGGFFMANGTWDQKMFDLQRDGWKVLKPGNFVLDDSTAPVCIPQ